MEQALIDLWSEAMFVRKSYPKQAFIRIGSTCSARPSPLLHNWLLKAVRDALELRQRSREVKLVLELVPGQEWLVLQGYLPESRPENISRVIRALRCLCVYALPPVSYGPERRVKAWMQDVDDDHRSDEEHKIIYPLGNLTQDFSKQALTAMYMIRAPC